MNSRKYLDEPTVTLMMNEQEHQIREEHNRYKFIDIYTFIALSYPNPL